MTGRPLRWLLLGGEFTDTTTAATGAGDGVGRPPAELLIARGAGATARDQEGRTARQRSAPGVAPCLALPSS
jgi:hypothetical protein